MSSSSVVPITPDVLVQNEGTVFLFCPLTSQGKEWIDEHVSPDAQWFGSALGRVNTIRDFVISWIRGDQRNAIRSHRVLPAAPAR